VTLSEFRELRKGNCVVSVERHPQTGIVVEITDNWLLVAWEDKDVEAVRKCATLEVEYFCRNTNLLATEEKDKPYPQPETAPKGGKRKKTSR